MDGLLEVETCSDSMDQLQHSDKEVRKGEHLLVCVQGTWGCSVEGEQPVKHRGPTIPRGMGKAQQGTYPVYDKHLLHRATLCFSAFQERLCGSHRL